MKKAYSFTLSGKVMRYSGAGGWYFIPLSKKDSEHIGKMKTAKKASFGYVRVKAKIGQTSWETTLWPREKERLYLLAIKATVRKKEGIFDGDTVRVAISLI